MLFSFGIALLLLGADALQRKHLSGKRIIWALYDASLHGLVALSVVSPILWIQEIGLRLAALSALSLLCGILIDLDHFVAARSLRIRDAMVLGGRPPTHSLTFILPVVLVLYLLLDSYVVAWVAFASLFSHLLRDASTGMTPILWPLPLRSLPRAVYIFGEVALLLTSYSISKIPTS